MYVYFYIFIQLAAPDRTVLAKNPPIHDLTSLLKRLIRKLAVKVISLISTFVFLAFGFSVSILSLLWPFREVFTQLCRKRSQNNNTTLQCQGGWWLLFGGGISLFMNTKAMVKEKLKGDSMGLIFGWCFFSSFPNLLGHTKERRLWHFTFFSFPFLAEKYLVSFLFLFFFFFFPLKEAHNRSLCWSTEWINVGEN